MGLDGVELVMTFEESFGVTITDAEAQACTTPGMVIDVILGKIRASDEQACVSQRAFYVLRKGLIQTLGVSRRSVTLDTDIRSFVGSLPEREIWDKLKMAVQARSWPALARPKWLVVGLWALSVGTFCALVARTHWILAVACALAVAFAAVWGTRPLRLFIPARFSPVRKLVPFAVTSDAIAWNRDQVAVLVKKLVIEQLGLRDDQYREDAHFVKDLGMN